MMLRLFIPASAAPSTAQRSLTFKETLSITQDNWFPYLINVDGQGNIYVLSGREKLLLGFDSIGREILRRQFSKGQGPGEFESLDIAFSRDGRLHATDWAQRRLTIFGPDFKIDHIDKMRFNGDLLQMDSKGQRYYIVYQPSKAKERNRVVLTKCSPSGDIIKEFVDYEWGPRAIGRALYEDSLYRTQVKYVLDAQDRFIYAFSNKYEVYIISPEGALLRTISRDIKPRQVDKDDVDRLLPDSSSKSPYKYIIPERVPAIAGIFPLEDGHLLIVTFEKTNSDNDLAGDLFDIDGRYISTCHVPRYYQWDFLMAPSKSRGFVWKNSFYTIETNLSEDKFWVKRYQLQWK